MNVDPLTAPSYGRKVQMDDDPTERQLHGMLDALARCLDQYRNLVGYPSTLDSADEAAYDTQIAAVRDGIVAGITALQTIDGLLNNPSA